MEELQTVFPNIPPMTLTAVMGICDGNTELAINYLLENDPSEITMTVLQSNEHTSDGEDNAVVLHPGTDDANQNAGILFPVAVEAGNTEYVSEGHNEIHTHGNIREEDPESSGSSSEEEEEGFLGFEYDLPYSREPKRRKITPSKPVVDEDGNEEKRFICIFDSTIVEKTHLELLNLHPSKLDHNFIAVWNYTVQARERAAKQLEIAAKEEYWTYFFPVSDVDHVWRVLLNAHIYGHKFGQVFTLSAASFDTKSNANAQVKCYGGISSNRPPSISEIKRIGVGLLGVMAPISDSREIFYGRGGQSRRKEDEFSADSFIINSELKLERAVKPRNENGPRLTINDDIYVESYHMFRRNRNGHAANSWVVADSDI